MIAELKGNYENNRFTSEKYPCINKNLWWFRFFLFRLGCWEILKKVQNETTKLFSLGNTRFYRNGATTGFCICCAMTWIRPTVKLRSNMNQTVLTMRSSISDGVSALLAVYWLAAS